MYDLQSRAPQQGLIVLSIGINENGKLDKDKQIYQPIPYLDKNPKRKAMLVEKVYSIGNGRSDVLSKYLLSKGLNEVYELEEGIGSWVGGGKLLFTTDKKGLCYSEFNRILASNKLVLEGISSKYYEARKK